MPLGTEHDETGRLIEQRGRPALQTDDGGIWRLDAGWFAWRTRRLMGRRVRVKGTRDGFDLLAVRSIEAA